MNSYPDVKHPKTYKSRLGGYGDFYFRVSQDEYSKLVDLEAKYESETDDYEKSEVGNLCFEAGVKTILFAALCVEASINDYAAWQLGDSYFEKHLANLDVASKWVVIPKLVCGKEINKSGAGYAELKALIRSRNELAHNKSKHLDINNPQLPSKLEARTTKFYGSAHAAYKTLLLISLEFDQLVGPHFNPLRTLDKEISPMLEIPSNIIGVYADCKNIITRNNNAS
ncbi:hypothetical protein KO507_03360 [Gilvimarinus agarilyticus]|uniref:hypothetical protein n=1 Tax=Gilvimarinus sp. 2_MG-2023 TaxID=3062666 RepID=UPI001C091F59|nr:hypothetical protein [Gilvimarinus sp. 2_MG-2023]MBU2884800.1 hypothetical protein [Gilvimarinus agarilyticus]MDO6569849.1 hypothetical protein [Gilvimarinus sp. 2_MG-2023]